MVSCCSLAVGRHCVPGLFDHAKVELRVARIPKIIASSSMKQNSGPMHNQREVADGKRAGRGPPSATIAEERLHAAPSPGSPPSTSAGW